MGLLIIDPKLPNTNQSNVVNHPKHPVVLSFISHKVRPFGP